MSGWQYPIYLIPHELGFASLVDPDADEDTDRLLLIVYSDETVATGFMHEHAILGLPRALHNDREFAWILRSVKSPVESVVFDPDPTGESMQARWRTSVEELLERHLTPDYSPWNYPVYVIALESGFVSIAGADGSGEATTAVGVFTSEEQVNVYLESAQLSGTACAIEGLPQARKFFQGVQQQVSAVALNPVIVDQQHTAARCFQLSTLLDKYLVEESE